ncbi:GAF and ANTAR domain-containing protein [Actinosynnema sp. NPDC020468]|uniref:GAF and ANTAR domain-containing protein n=1 Tax=Actinosynnema sp. NPDC020468 TaxID=3154488 RepID=UPI003411689F
MLEQRLARTFVELADTLASGLDVIEFLQVLAERCGQVLDAPVVGVLLADHRGTLNLMAASRERPDLLELFHLQQDVGPAVEAYRTGSPVTLAHADLPPGPFATLVGECGFEVVQAVPMRLGERIVGVVNLFRADGLGEDDAEVVRAFADLAAISLPHIRSRAYQELLAEQLRRALHDRITVEQAKGVLSEVRGISPTEAFTAMRVWARERQRQVVDVARAVIRDDADVAGLLRPDA